MAESGEPLHLTIVMSDMTIAATQKNIKNKKIIIIINHLCIHLYLSSVF